jgi:putative membrane protein
MERLFLHWVVSAVALAVSAYLLPGVDVQSAPALLVAALVLGFLNAVLKPVLVVLTLPITIVTLGIFYFVLNAILFALAATLVPGFVVAGFGSAFFGAIVMGLVSWFLGGLLKREDG